MFVFSFVHVCFFFLLLFFTFILIQKVSAIIEVSLMVQVLCNFSEHENCNLLQKKKANQMSLN